VPVTINERTLADSFWPVLKRTGLAEGRDIGGRFEPNIMRAVKGLRLRPGECARRAT
jgi:molecular chaperone GrpE (heat shock protein)